MTDWVERCSWALRTGELGELGIGMTDARVSRTGVVRPSVRVPTMEFGAPGSTVKVGAGVWELWSELPRHPSILEVIKPTVLRYAAIDWRVQPSERTIARAGIELAHTLELVFARTGAARAGWLTSPVVKLDLEGEVRVAFASPGQASLPLDHFPPEIAQTWPACDERAFVYAVGKGVQQLGSSPELDPIVRRCIAPSCNERFARLEDVVIALRVIAREARARAALRGDRKVWDHLERGLGYLALGNRVDAANAFGDATKLDPKSDLAHELHALALERPDGPTTMSGEISEPPPRPRPGPPPEVQRHVDPWTSIPAPAPRRVYAVANQKVTSSAIRSTGLAPTPLVRYADMLAHSEAMDPEDGASHHLRGKALLGLGRIDEARAAFDRACTLKPQLLEAMLLRGACDRAMTTAREATGVAKPITDQLAELRDVLVDGRVVDAIQMLRRPAYDDDHTAQLLLAELLCSDDRHDDAFAIYDRLATPEAHLGRARALIALDRPAEALAALDHTALDEALDVRARALLALGRGDEAEALRDEYIRRISQRSDRRLAHF